MRSRGALTFRAPYGTMSARGLAHLVHEARHEVALASVRAYGLGYFVAPDERVACCLHDDEVEFRITVDTPDAGARLIEEVQRQKRLSEMVVLSVMRGGAS